MISSFKAKKKKKKGRTEGWKERGREKGEREGGRKKEGKARTSTLGQHFPIKHIGCYISSLVKEDVITQINIDKANDPE